MIHLPIVEISIEMHTSTWIQNGTLYAVVVVVVVVFIVVVVLVIVW